MQPFNRNDPSEAARVAALHPGGNPLSPAPRLSDDERLARAETELLSLAIERGCAATCGQERDLAISIVALRAACGR
ncbi:hypothetical protein SAMN05192583_1401 [Sphingomonas gellani]|uniref:Uncharacterized protein n=1 Tax=Sphingomonas gellani TaxID=1166340 RepID=A0A1H8C0E4_9SPHN|nr:hypothetical protein SAMN05192583_1401 [Sphingomonas gellani]